jgi:hypothetical protein
MLTNRVQNFVEHMKEKNSTITRFIIICIAVIAGLGSTPSYAQVDPEDPFRGNYLLGENSEIVIVSGVNGNAQIRIVDANGDITTGGLTEANNQFIEAPWGIYGNTEQVDLATGDFNNDGFDEFIGIWPGPDSTVTLFIPEIDQESFSWTNATRKSVQDDGFPKLKEEEDISQLKGWIRMVPGQFDDDNEPEFVVAYWADTGDTDGGPIQIILYDTDGTLMPQPRAHIANRKLSPFIADASRNLREGSRFDITTGDFDRDDTDEIVLVYVEPGPASSAGDIGWKMSASLYDFQNGELVETLNTPVTNSFGSTLERSGNSNEFVQRLSITTGDFNGDFKDDDFAEAKKLIKASGLQIAAVDCETFGDRKFRKGALTSTDPKIRKDAVEIVKRAGEVAKELNVPVIALSQLSRAVENRPGGSKKPMLSDLRESGAIEQDADMVMFLYRPEYYGITEDEDGNNTAGVGEVIIAKHRNGSLENIKLRFIGKYTKFEDFSDNFSMPNELPDGLPDGNFKTMGSRMNEEDNAFPESPSDNSSDDEDDNPLF